MYHCPHCSKFYKTKRGLDFHLFDKHNNKPIKNIEKEEGWDEDELDLAIELSMKDKFKEFIPDDNLIEEMITNDKNKCVACLTRSPDMVFINCGHLVICEKCSKKFTGNRKKCPICRKRSSTFLKIYTS